MANNNDDIDDDVNDTEDYVETDEQEGGVFRWMSVVVLLLAIGGFFGLAWYAYKSGGEVIDEKDAELIQADTKPVKEAPANPGGMPIPNQDKSVYGLVGGKPEEGKVVEHILASPETPVARNEESDTGTWMSDQVKEKLKANEGEKGGLPPVAASTLKEAPVAPGAAPVEKVEETPVAKVEQFKPAKEHIVAEEKPEVKEPVKTELPKEEKPAEPKAAETKAAEVKEPVAEAKKPEEKEVVEEKPVAPPTPAEKKQETTQAKATTSTTPPSGARAQLGAFKSQAEAEGQWKKIAKKFASSLGGKEHYVVRADLGDKGVFYRLQVAPFTSSKDAEQFCLDLVSDGQGCILAKGK